MARDKGDQVASRLAAFRAAQEAARADAGGYSSPVQDIPPEPAGKIRKSAPVVEPEAVFSVEYTPRERGRFIKDILEYSQPVAPWIFVLGAFLWIVACIGVVGEWYGVLGHATMWAEAAAGSFVLVAGLVALWQRRGGTTFRAQIVVSVVGLLIVGMFSLGAVRSVVLHGRVYAATSTTARSWTMAHQMYEQVGVLEGYSKLLGYPYAVGETHILEISPGISQLQSIAQSWANTTPGSLPSYRFIRAAQDLSTAASYGANALTDQQQYLSQDDQAANLLAKTAKSSMNYYIDRALVDLGEIANHYGFSLGSGAK